MDGWARHFHLAIGDHVYSIPMAGMYEFLATIASRA